MVGEKPVLIFDGDCGFCTSSAQWVERRWSVEAEAIPWQRLGAEGLLNLGLTEEQAAASAWWVDASGHLYEADQAVAQSLVACQKPWRWLGLVAAAPPGRWLAGFVYPLVAHNRHRLPGATPACHVDPGP